MAKTVKQYRYYNTNSQNNQPSNISKAELINGLVFEKTGCYPILQLGIQTMPGTKFYLNGNIDPVIVGYTGIYELDMDNAIEIVRLTFNKDSMDLIENNENAYLIVDVLYEDGAGEL